MSRLIRSRLVVALALAAVFISLPAGTGDEAVATPGDPAPGFGVAGTVQAFVDGPVRASVVSDTGVSYVVGCSRPPPGSGLANVLAVTAWAFDPDGEPLSGFGVDGVSRVDVAPLDHCARAVALDGAGNLVVAGTATESDGTTLSLLLLRVNGDTGALDTTFGTGGTTSLVDAPRHLTPDAIAVADSSSIVVAGSRFTPGAGTEMALWAFEPGGVPSGGFGTDGTFVVSPGSTSQASFSDVAIRPDGSIVATGTVATASPAGGVRDEVAAVQVTADGVLDSSFGADGVRIVGAVTGGPSMGDRGTATALDARSATLAPDGDLVVVGRRSGARASNPAVLRIDPTGELDSDFDGDGLRNLDGGQGRNGFASAVWLDAAGRVLVGGSGFDGELRRGFVHRLTAGGVDDHAFADQGRQFVESFLSVQHLRTLGDAIVTTGLYSQLSQVVALTRLVVDDAPVAPGGVVAVPIDAGATVGWEPVVAGPAVASYTVTADPGGATCTTDSNRCDVTGLDNGTTYRFTVTAASSDGEISRASQPSNVVTPPDSYLAAAGPPTPPNVIASDLCVRTTCETVFVELALILDGSDSYRSVFASQLANYRDIFTDPTFFDTFVEPLPDQAIAVSFFQFAGDAPNNVRQEVEWRVIRSQADATAFGEAVGAVAFVGGLSPIWDAVRAARTSLRSNTIQGRFLTIDIDSDGLTTGGTTSPTREIRDAKRVSQIDAINALVSPADSDAPFDDFHLEWAVEVGRPDDPSFGIDERWNNPDGGPGRLFVARTFAEHAAALRTKLAFEIAVQPDVVLQPDPPRLPDPPVPPTTIPVTITPSATTAPPATTTIPPPDNTTAPSAPTTGPPVATASPPVPSDGPRVTSPPTPAPRPDITAPPGGVTTTPDRPVPDLPRTGAGLPAQLGSAAAVVLGGAALVLVARRRRRA